MKAEEIEKLIAEANSFASYKSSAAVSAIGEATQNILTAEGIPASLQAPIRGRNAGDAAGKEPAVGGDSFGPGEHGAAAHTPLRVGADGMGPQTGLATYVGPHVSSAGFKQAGDGIATSGGSAPSSMPLSGVGGYAPVASQACTPSSAGRNPTPAASIGGAMSSSFGSSFAQGAATGKPADAGSHSLAEGAMNAFGSTSSPSP